MKRNVSALVMLGVLLLIAAPCFPFSTEGKHYVEMLVRGGPESQRDAARNIFNGSLREQEVYDVVAEVLLQVYQRQGFVETDTTSWLCKALGASNNSRYRGVLQEVIDRAPDRKVKKYATDSLNMIPQGNAEPYRPGTVNLEKLRNSNISGQDSQPRPQGKHKGGGSFDQISQGMSMEEVYNLIGQPTSTTARPTGKAWAPFYYGGDTERLFALYKGKGRIVFSNSSRYSSVWRVVEIVPDSTESGYP
jgi:hypothetical protein